MQTGNAISPIVSCRPITTTLFAHSAFKTMTRMLAICQSGLLTLPCQIMPAGSLDSGSG